jgi:hypothetical protein
MKTTDYKILQINRAVTALESIERFYFFHNPEAQAIEDVKKMLASKLAQEELTSYEEEQAEKPWVNPMLMNRIPTRVMK